MKELIAVYIGKSKDFNIENVTVKGTATMKKEGNENDKK